MRWSTTWLKMLVVTDKVGSPWLLPPEPKFPGRLWSDLLELFCPRCPVATGSSTLHLLGIRWVFFSGPHWHCHLLPHLVFPANTRVSRAGMVSWGEPFCRGQAAGLGRANTATRGSNRSHNECCTGPGLGHNADALIAGQCVTWAVNYYKVQRKLVWSADQGLSKGESGPHALQHLYWPLLATLFWTPLCRVSKLKYHGSNLETLVTSEGLLEDPKLLISPHSETNSTKIWRVASFWWQSYRRVHFAHLSCNIGKIKIIPLFLKRKNLEPRKSELLATSTFCRIFATTKFFHSTWPHVILTKPEVWMSSSSFLWGSWWSQRCRVSWPRPHSVKGSAWLLA